MSKTRISTIGLIFITFLSAIQYIFLQNVPDSVSTFSFLCITNLIGLIILGAAQLKKLRGLEKKTLLKGALFALELTGFNFFLLLGSRNMDSVIISSVVSMYFVFITPMLLLLKKKVNFFSGIATVIAIIALVLMFGADTDKLFGSVNVIYLVLADLFFASYVVSVSIYGEGEDSMQLTISQMLFAVLFALVGWVIESGMGSGSFSLPHQKEFWISAIFIGVCIRAVYGLIQITAQKYVSAINTSLIISSEIIITLVMNPFLCRLLGSPYIPATAYQIVGCVLFILAALMVDEAMMSRLGFDDLEVKTVINEQGEVVQRSSVSRKMIFNTLMFTMMTLILSTIMCLSAIHVIRISSVEYSAKLGQTASITSSEALIEELELKLQRIAEAKAKTAEIRLSGYSAATMCSASFAESLYRGGKDYPEKEVSFPKAENAGKWTMQLTLADSGMRPGVVQDEINLLGNMIDIFEPLVKNIDNIATIYIATETGILVSYDQNSDSEGRADGSYYDYRKSNWYTTGKYASDYAFIDTYQDRYGRGLTITCVAPFRDKSGRFHGCVAMDILMNDLNKSMVSDGIFYPNTATMIDDTGKIIAAKDLNPYAERVQTIFSKDSDSVLKEVGREIIENKDGMTRYGLGNASIYIAYATVDSTGWILCITSPIASVLRPAALIDESIAESTEYVVAAVEHGVFDVVQNCLILSAILLLVVTFFIGKMSRKISDPLKHLEQDVQKISSGNFDQHTDVDTNDEIGNLARSFNTMTDALQQYIEDLKEVTAKEERIAMELSVATKIQAAMLPSEFPAFPDRKEFDLYATMNPAKEVGGDFYDFFLIDEDHLALVMADVSGKGVPAALFMVIAKTLIKDRARMGGTPSEILHDVNEQICEGNKEGMFVTVWLAIVELSTGKVVESNAGHEHPAIRRKDGIFDLEVTRHSPAVATIEGIRFRQNELQLYPGDRLFVYTDGVPEATNAQDVLFGPERMLRSLNQRKDSAPKELLEGVWEDINAFVKDAPQFDDATMLCFDYYQK